MPGELTKSQEVLLDQLAASSLSERFYLTGGTALSAFYFHHRQSEDLDLFSRSPFDVTTLLALIESVADHQPTLRRRDDRWGFLLEIQGQPLRVEFVRYEHDHIEPPQPLRGSLRVDGLRDLLANKLSAIIERTTGKDFADIVYLLRRPELTLEQGVADCRQKFGWPGLEYLLQPALLKVERVRDWPTLDPPLTQDEATRELRDYARVLVRHRGE